MSKCCTSEFILLDTFMLHGPMYIYCMYFEHLSQTKLCGKRESESVCGTWDTVIYIIRIFSTTIACLSENPLSTGIAVRSFMSSVRRSI